MQEILTLAAGDDPNAVAPAAGHDPIGIGVRIIKGEIMAVALWVVRWPWLHFSPVDAIR